MLEEQIKGARSDLFRAMARGLERSYPNHLLLETDGDVLKGWSLEFAQSSQDKVAINPFRVNAHITHEMLECSWRWLITVIAKRACMQLPVGSIESLTWQLCLQILGFHCWGVWNLSSEGQMWNKVCSMCWIKVRSGSNLIWRNQTSPMGNFRSQIMAWTSIGLTAMIREIKSNQWDINSSWIDPTK